MNRQTIAIGAIAVLAVAAVVGVIVLRGRANRANLTGEVLKVRSYQMDPEHTIVLIDARVRNPSPQEFIVREIEVFIEEADGAAKAAEVFAESDIQRVIDYYPTLGKKDNRGLRRRDKLNPGDVTDRTIAVSAPMTDQRLGTRRNLRIVVHEIEGAKAEFTERRPSGS